MTIGATETPVRCVNCVVENDWIEYLTAFGGLVGLIVAVTALIFAYHSARDASRAAAAAGRTAAAAEITAETLRAEHEAEQRERARRPELEVTINVEKRWRDPDGRPFVILEAGVTNHGKREANRAGFNLKVPADFILWTCNQAGGADRRLWNVLKATEPPAEGQDPIDWIYAHGQLDVAAGRAIVGYYQLVAPEPGVYPVKYVVSHADAPGGGDGKLAWLDLTADALPPRSP